MSETKEKRQPQELPIWKIPVTWAMEGEIAVPAATLQEAINLTHTIDEPTQNGNYVLGSFEPISPYTETIRRLYNHNQPDMVKLGE